MSPKEHDEKGYIIETVTIGGSMKVTALDPKTLLEATVIMPVSTTRQEASDLAIRKLHYLMEKQKGTP